MISNTRGQVVVEYVLLLTLSVAFAALLVNLFVSRSSDNPGVLVQKWKDLQEEVGKDLPDKCSNKGGAASCSNPP